MTKLTTMTRVIPTVFLGASLLMATSTLIASDLDQAKRQGLVCELPTGYLKPMPGATASVGALVERINAKRQAEYRRIANEHGTTADQVGRMTAEKLSPRCN